MFWKVNKKVRKRGTNILNKNTFLLSLINVEKLTFFLVFLQTYFSFPFYFFVTHNQVLTAKHFFKCFYAVQLICTMDKCTSANNPGPHNNKQGRNSFPPFLRLFVTW